MKTSLRRGRDSNPRCSHPHNSLAGSPIQPLSHLSKSVKDSKSLGLRSVESLSKTEGVGFEPTAGCPAPVFKTGSLNRSVTPPVPGMQNIRKAGSLSMQNGKIPCIVMIIDTAIIVEANSFGCQQLFLQCGTHGVLDSNTSS